MGMNWKNYLTRLGIEYEDIMSTLEELTDDIVDEAYADRLVDIYMSLQKGHNKNEEEVKWEELENKLKEELNQQLRQMSPKAKIIILENKIEELKKTKLEEMNLKIRKENYRIAYEVLKTKESRRNYMRNLKKEGYFNQDLQGLITLGENSNSMLETKIFNNGNVAKDVREEETDKPEYNVEYSDENVTLCQIASITFDNGQFQDRFKKYILFMENEQNNISTGYSFFGEVEEEKMQDSFYRMSLYQAIRQNIMEGENYIGYLRKSGDKFFIIKDAAQKLASLEYEKQQREMKRNIKKQKGEER